MTTHLLDAGRAAWISEAAAQKTFTDRPTLALDGTGADEKRALLWYPNPLGRLGDGVTSAILTVYTSNAWSGTTQITVKRITQSWKQASVKWGNTGNNPSTTATNAEVASVTNVPAGTAIPLDLTAMFADVAAGSPWYGVRIEIDAQGPLRLHSPNSAQKLLRPKLLVDLVSAPDAPDGLKPDGTNRAHADGQPTLQWEFSSSDASAYQVQSRVQISDTESDYSTPVYDSDWRDNAEVHWDTSLDDVVIALLDDDSTFYWRVAVRDQNGQESEYSDEATFLHASLGDLQIVDPVQDDDAVPDNTPTIEWYTDDREQRLVRVRIYAAVNGELGTLLYERPWQAQQQDELDGVPLGVDTYTIPSTVPSRKGTGAPIISSATETYAIEIAMRDEYARPDSDYVSDTRYFAYTPDGSVTPPTTVTASGAGPIVTLNWEAATPPDAWVITRDGVIIAEYDADELFVSGTSYRAKDFTALIGVSYQYAVHAKASGGGMSVSVPAATTVTLTPVAVWLMDPEQEIAIPILGQQDVPKNLDEISVSLAALNRRAPVRIVSRIGGYSGSVSGTLATWNGYDVEDSLAKLEDIFGSRSTARLQLVAGTASMPVNVGGLSVSQDPTQRGDAAMYDVSFSYWQIGSFSVDVN